MFSIPRAQSAASSVFSTYGTIMLVKSMANEFVPRPVRSWLNYTFWYLFNPLSSTVKITVEELSGYIRNEVYDAAEIYLQTKTTPNTLRYTVTKTSKQDTINVAIGKGEALIDTYDGITLTWRFTAVESRRRINPENPNSESKFFVLTFHKKFKDRVFNEYLPYIMEKSKEIRDGKRALKIYTADPIAGGRGSVWKSVNFIHPATFETLAMEPEMKTAIIDDLGRFVGRREYYKKVGKAWKRGYLLYGPPGTGKSSLIAAMANYLRFDIYDLDLTQFASNSNLRNALLSTTNKSIIVIEDIDCTVELKDRESPPVLPGKSSKVLGYHQQSEPKITLSGLLNLIDGLWSSCGDERIIIFTTNHKDKLDPALLRPGRMDMHIHMSYLTNSGFKLLAFNYLGLEHNDRNHQTTFDEIKNLIEEVEVTPAQVAEELMKSGDSDIALGGVVNFLKRKREEAAITTAKQEGGEKPQEEKDDGEEEVKEPDAKKLKILHSNGRLGLTPTECDGLGVVLIDG